MNSNIDLINLNSLNTNNTEFSTNNNLNYNNNKINNNNKVKMIKIGKKDEFNVIHNLKDKNYNSIHINNNNNKNLNYEINNVKTSIDNNNNNSLKMNSEKNSINRINIPRQYKKKSLSPKIIHNNNNNHNNNIININDLSSDYIPFNKSINNNNNNQKNEKKSIKTFISTNPFKRKCVSPPPNNHFKTITNIENNSNNNSIDHKYTNYKINISTNNVKNDELIKYFNLPKNFYPTNYQSNNDSYAKNNNFNSNNNNGSYVEIMKEK